MEVYIIQCRLRLLFVVSVCCGWSLFPGTVVTYAEAAADRSPPIASFAFESCLWAVGANMAISLALYALDAGARAGFVDLDFAYAAVSSSVAVAEVKGDSAVRRVFIEDGLVIDEAGQAGGVKGGGALED